MTMTEDATPTPIGAGHTLNQLAALVGQARLWCDLGHPERASALLGEAQVAARALKAEPRRRLVMDLRTPRQ